MGDNASCTPLKSLEIILFSILAHLSHRLMYRVLSDCFLYQLLRKKKKPKSVNHLKYATLVGEKLMR